MPIHRRLPKRGFTNIFRREMAVVNIRDLARFESGATVDESALVQARLVKGKRDGIKLLAYGDVSHPLHIKVNAVSDSARQKIEAVGGSVEVV
jgi:large subunit ribosomal protein L15